MSGIPRAKFPKSAHLLKHADFRRVYDIGRRQFSGNFTTFFLPRTSGENGSCPVRVGFTISRAMGGAVERNRMRRRMREAVRFHLGELAELPIPVDIVMNPKKSVLKVEFSVLSSEVSQAFQAIRQKLERGKATSAKEDS